MHSNVNHNPIQNFSYVIASLEKQNTNRSLSIEIEERRVSEKAW